MADEKNEAPAVREEDSVMNLARTLRKFYPYENVLFDKKVKAVLARGPHKVKTPKK